MRLMPRLASDMATSLKKAIGCRTLLSGSLLKAADPISPTAPLLHLRELSSGRDSRRLPFSRRIELFEIGDDIVNLLRIFQAWKSHLGAGYLDLRILDVFAEGGVVPSDSGILVRGLSMSHDIVVKQHGGTIEVVTEPGSFTEFII